MSAMSSLTHALTVEVYRSKRRSQTKLIQIGKKVGETVVPQVCGLWLSNAEITYVLFSSAGKIIWTALQLSAKAVSATRWALWFLYNRRTLCTTKPHILTLQSWTQQIVRTVTYILSLLLSKYPGQFAAVNKKQKRRRRVLQAALFIPPPPFIMCMYETKLFTGHRSCKYMNMQAAHRRKTSTLGSKALLAQNRGYVGS